MTTQFTPPSTEFEPPTNAFPAQFGPAPSLPVGPPRARRTFGLGVVVLAAVAGLFAGVGFTVAVVMFGTTGSAQPTPSAAAPLSTGSILTPDTFGIVGSLTLTDGATVSGMTCTGTGGYDDIEGGASVTISDATGTVVATSTLGPGAGSRSSCVFPFSVADVPGSSDFYRIEISHRGEVTYSRAAAEAGVSMSLGS